MLIARLLKRSNFPRGWLDTRKNVDNNVGVEECALYHSSLILF